MREHNPCKKAYFFEVDHATPTRQVAASFVSELRMSAGNG
jgi:hypothetical protein